MFLLNTIILTVFSSFLGLLCSRQLVPFFKGREERVLSSDNLPSRICPMAQLIMYLRVCLTRLTWATIGMLNRAKLAENL
jgi:hypothetical protein